ncbi:MAG: TlpA disulfide reductase family protein [Gemmatimonadota bacterium]
MKTRLFAVTLSFAIVAGAVAPAIVVAQTAPLSPPATCLKAAKDGLSAQIVATRITKANAPAVTDAEILDRNLMASRVALRAAEKLAKDCAATFNLSTIAPVQLVDLIPLYDYARDTVSSRLAYERMLSVELPVRARGNALRFAVSREVSAANGLFGIVDAAERYVALIDQLPDSLADLKLAAHRGMLGYYEYKDVAEGMRAHGTALIALARQLNKPADVLFGYGELARSYADRLQPDSALRILDAAEKELGAPAVEKFADFRHRYALIGTRAPKIAAQWWVNSDSTRVVSPAPGKVTLIEFTAHWCGPCKNSYPGLNGLAERLKGKDFQGVIVTQLYGYLGVRRSLTPDQEVAADREYYGKENGLAFPVAINPQVKPDAEGRSVAPQPDLAYRVQGIPQIVIIDKHGIIRQIVTGWDQGNIDRFTAFIEQLLAEK